jgi:rhodanese-related sulfurtransferase
MWIRLFFVINALFIMILSGLGFSWATDEFPLRKKYPQLKPITTQELTKARSANEALVIDARTKGEFDVMHVKGAVNIPHIWSEDHRHTLGSIAKAPHRLLVFYCNGVLCSKSYKAAELATALGFEGVRNYDAGIFEWAQANPEETLFFGEPMTPENVSRKVIPESDFKKALVDTFTFIDLAKSGNYVVCDLRDSREKAEYPISLPNKIEATIDELQELLQKGNFTKSRVLFFDNVGKQVTWAQYYLERHGVKDYYFLAGGVRQWRADGRDGKGNQLGRLFGHAPKKQ